MEEAIHPRLVKRSVSKDKLTNREYVAELNASKMIIVAETYNKGGDKFPENPTKKIAILDINSHTASIKLTTDIWIDYIHLIKTNGEWKIINILWQYIDS